MKKTVLLAGKNIEKTIINLDNLSTILTDENNISWLDLPFKNQTIRSDKIEVIDSEFSAKKKIFEKHDFQTISMLGSEIPSKQFCLVKNNQSVKFEASNSKMFWQDPEFTPEYLFIDESADYTDDDFQRIAEYCNNFPDIKIILAGENAHKLNDLTNQTLVYINVPNEKFYTNFVNKFKNKNWRIIGDNNGEFYISDINQTLKFNMKFDELKFDFIIENLDLFFSKSSNEIILEKMREQIGKPDVELLLIEGYKDFNLQIEKNINKIFNSKLTADLSSIKDIEFVKNILNTKDAKNIGLIQLPKNILEELNAAEFNSGLSVVVDDDFEVMPGSPNELITVGLDKIQDILQVASKKGVLAAVWRIVLNYENDLPSAGAILSNCHMASRFAASSIENGLIPIVQLNKSEYFDKNDLNAFLESLVNELKLMKVDSHKVILSLDGKLDVDLEILKSFAGIFGQPVNQEIKALKKLDQEAIKKIMTLPIYKEEQKQIVRTKFADIIYSALDI